MRLKNKMNCLFISLIIVSMTVSGFVFNYIAKNIILEELFTQIQTVQKLKIKIIEKFFFDITTDMAIIVDNIIDKDKVKAFLASSDSRPRDSNAVYIDNFLGLLIKKNNYENIMLANANGIILYAANPKYKELEVNTILSSEAIKYFVTYHNSIFISDIKSNKIANEPYIIELVRKISDINNTSIGYMIIQINMNYLYEILADTTGLGKTGESFIVKADSLNNAIFLSPLRNVKNAVLNKIVKLGSTIAIPAQRAINHESGVGLSIDYRGVDVIASWDYIPLLNWGFVVKLDAQEAMRDIVKLRYLFFGISIFIVLIIISISMFMSNLLVKPILKLQYGVSKVAEQDWNYRIVCDTKDEFFELGASFNSMIEQLQKNTISRQVLETEIIDRKKIEKDLENNRGELEILLHVISHDLKEPLRALEYFSTSIYMQLIDKIEDKPKDYLIRIANAAKKMSKLLDDVALLSRARQISLPEEECSSKQIVEEVLERLSQKIKKTNAKITVAEDLPIIKVHHFWALEAIYNLVGNALKFVNEGCSPEIDIIPYRGNKGIGISVCDRGMGINPEYSGEIFELFKRGVGGEIEGTGAGLAIVKEIAVRHGGTVWVEAREKGGSIFTITFSCAKG